MQVDLYYGCKTVVVVVVVVVDFRTAMFGLTQVVNCMC